MKKKTVLSFFIVLLIPLFLTAVFVVTIDPFFHYHAPIKGFPYVLSEERYQNDGIVRHFDYEAMITGPSTTQNFKVSDAERLFGKKTVKACFSGATYKEIDRITKVALKSNENLRLVIRGLDMTRITDDKDLMAYDEYPQYLYDRNPFNDYDYIFNKDVIKIIGEGFEKLLKGKGPTDFDEYGNFAAGKTFSKEAVLAGYTRLSRDEYEELAFGEEDRSKIKQNVEQNIIETAKSNPDVMFYVFVPPVSVCTWDALRITGSFDSTLASLRYMYDLLLEVDNIRIYGFDDRIDITGDLDNYMDPVHYSPDINSLILECMARDEGLITKENLEEYLARVRENYENFNYDSLFE
ncbi:MAG: hypothetical protein K6E32_05700 [Lachnospiraceae bacterium]|nr:hypothetical protein [Lachnospiraceae bacterium]